MTNYLIHYGVLGMKWGEHRAAKRGEQYHYKSQNTKSFEKARDDNARIASKFSKKKEEAMLAGKNKKAERYKNKEEQYAKSAARLGRYAKYSGEVDSKMQQAAKNRSTGRTIVRALLYGPLSDHASLTAEALGKSRSTQRGARLLSAIYLPLGSVYANKLRAEYYDYRESSSNNRKG